MPMFKFLITQRKSRQLLDRRTLVQQCIHDRSILTFIADATITAVKANQSYPTQMSFYATLVSQYINELLHVDDKALQFLVPYVIKGLETPKADSHLVSYMILNSQTQRVKFSSEMLSELIPVLIDTSVDTRATILCLSHCSIAAFLGWALFLLKLSAASPR